MTIDSRSGGDDEKAHGMAALHPSQLTGTLIQPRERRTHRVVRVLGCDPSQVDRGGVQVLVP